MAQSSIADIYWVFNPSTRQVEIIADGVILETTTIALAAARVTFHRGELAKASRLCRQQPLQAPESWGALMGYFKTLMIDVSAARQYSQRWAQNDQVEAFSKNSHLVSSHRSVNAPTTATTLAQPINITREHVGKALRHYRRQVEGNDRDTNALNRCALNLEACLWTINGDELVITSATNSRRRYHVTATSCECKAAASGVVCWHRWAWMVLDMARHAQAPQKPVQRATEDVQAAIDELF